MRKRTSIGKPREPLDLDGFAPFFIGAISNKWTTLSSRLYLQRFGIGMTEWRVLGSLGARGGNGRASAIEIVTLLGIDAAAISRAMGKLEHLGHVVAVPGTFPGRTRPYAMTPKGAALFDRVRDMALQREKVLLQDLSPSEQDLLLAMLKKLHARLPDVQKFEDDIE